MRFKFIVVSYTGKLLGQESDRAGKWDSDEWGCEVQAETGKHTVGPQVNCYSSSTNPCKVHFIGTMFYGYVFAYCLFKEQIISTSKTFPQNSPSKSFAFAKW